MENPERERARTLSQIRMRRSRARGVREGYYVTNCRLSGREGEPHGSVPGSRCTTEGN